MKRMFGLGLLLWALIVVVGSLLSLILRGRSLSSERAASLEIAVIAGIVLALAAGWVITGAGEDRAPARRLRTLAPAFVAAAMVAACLAYLHERIQATEPVPDAYVGWSQYRSRHFLFVYPPDSLPSDRIRALGASADRRYEAIVRELDVGFDERITFFVYADQVQARDVLGREAGFGDPARLEVHCVRDDDGGPEQAYVIACEGYGAETRYALLGEGLSAHLGGDGDDHWSAVIRLLKGDLHSVRDLAAGWYAGSDAFRREAASFVKYLLETYGSKDFRQMWAASDLDAAARRVYGKGLARVEADWQGVLAEMAGFRSLAELEATRSERVDVDSAVGRSVVGLLDALTAAHEAGREREAQDLLAPDASMAARRLLASPGSGRRVVEAHVRSISGYGNRCYVGSVHLVTVGDAEEREVDADMLVAPRLGKMRLIHIEPRRPVQF
ncbi:MAG: hypothetical protein ACE5O2_17290 [Armatimonadota bacterium]